MVTYWPENHGCHTKFSSVGNYDYENTEAHHTHTSRVTLYLTYTGRGMGKRGGCTYHVNKKIKILWNLNCVSIECLTHLPTNKKYFQSSKWYFT